jgi:hypothetical protein
MLAIARVNLEASGIRNAQVRHGEIYALPFPDGFSDFVTIHQVLHFLEDPARALAEAARILEPGGRLMIVDFAPHDLDELRTGHAHRRLGIAAEHMAQWLPAPASPSPSMTCCRRPGARRHRPHRLALAGHASPAPPSQLLPQHWTAPHDRLRRRRTGITVSLRVLPAEGRGDESFWRTIRKLETVSPQFVSVTYGAGGTTRDRTLNTVRRIAAETSLKPAAHLTCVGASKERSERHGARLHAAGVCATSWPFAAIRLAVSAHASCRTRWLPQRRRPRARHPRAG